MTVAKGLTKLGDHLSRFFQSKPVKVAALPTMFGTGAYAMFTPAGEGLNNFSEAVDELAETTNGGAQGVLEEINKSFGIILLAAVLIIGAVVVFKNDRIP